MPDNQWKTLEDRLIWGTINRPVPMGPGERKGEIMGIELQEFYPDPGLKELMKDSDAAIAGMLAAHPKIEGDAKALVEFIRQSAWRVFATLCVIERPEMIEHFSKEGSHQDSLPLHFYPRSSTHSWGVQACGKPDRSIDDVLGRVFKISNGWSENIAGQFCSKQWVYTAPIFRPELRFVHDFHKETHLPFMNSIQLYSNVGNSPVLCTTVHSGHLVTKFV
jgi:hypothetical protein